MKTLHIFDPRLVNHGGHYANYCSQIVREMRSRGIAVRIYARKGCSVTCEGVQPEPLFSHDLFVEPGRDPEVWAIENFHAVNHAFLADLCRLPMDRFAADDLVFFPTLLQNQIHAIAQWLGRFRPERRPAVSVLLRYLTHEMAYNKARAHAELIALYYRYSTRALAAIQPRTVLAADTREMAQAFQAITGLPVHELTIAMEPPAADPTVRPAADGRPVVAYLGHTSQLKGFHFLPEIVHRGLQRRPRPRFVIQVQDRQAALRDRMGAVLTLLDRFVGPDVELVSGALPPEAYYRLLNRADIVILPYSSQYYGTCSSGVFAEAAALGKVIVAPAGTVPARQAVEHGLGAVIAPEWTAGSLAAAVAEATSNLPALQARAAAAAEAFRADQSVTAFWDRLFAALSAPEAAPAAAA